MQWRSFHWGNRGSCLGKKKSTTKIRRFIFYFFFKFPHAQWQWKNQISFVYWFIKAITTHFKTKKMCFPYLKCCWLRGWGASLPRPLASVIFDPKLRPWAEAMNRRTDNTMAKSKGTKNDLQNTTQKTKDWATRTSLKTKGELRCTGKVGGSCSTFDVLNYLLKLLYH